MRAPPAYNTGQMQTFLPYPDFAKSAATLDRQRLGKMRIEPLQLLGAMMEGARGWTRHPATLMYREHPGALVAYQDAICHEWTEVRGYKDTCRDKMAALYCDLMRSRGHAEDEIPGLLARAREGRTEDMPSWLGDEDFHRSHRSTLLRKDPVFYAPKFETDLADDIECIWPVTRDDLASVAS